MVDGQDQPPGPAELLAAAVWLENRPIDQIPSEFDPRRVWAELSTRHLLDAGVSHQRRVVWEEAE